MDFVYGPPTRYGQPALRSFHGATGTNPTLCYYLELDPTGTKRDFLTGLGMIGGVIVTAALPP
ncbi:hypothetical protein ACNTMW_28270 [Planosporangium sp. 12N6]|uniref:hypothetical protein n=1 Tax=Planosporangium spinosum TaxID=3402278 RepID=UPI003CF4F0BB